MSIPPELGLSRDNRIGRSGDGPEARRESRVLGYLGLFTSVGTLLCCALPSLFVLLGLGTTVASVLSSTPWLVSLSHHKNWIFSVSAAMIGANFYYLYQVAPSLLVERGVCSPEDPGACARATRVSRVVLWVSAGLLTIGFATAYMLPAILERMDS